MIVLDDDGGDGGNEGFSQWGANWEIVTVATRYLTLPAKYNALAALAVGADILVVWEDDDIYFPWHIEAHVLALASHDWSYPSQVWSLYGGTLHQEPSGGRFHASLAFRRSALEAVGGWPDTPRGDFDQQLIARFRKRFGEPADPGQLPSYVFRWGSTGSYHSQSFMAGTGGEWYDRMPQRVAFQGRLRIVPTLDQETIDVFQQLTKESTL
ncbi:MAG: hypothetical protein DDT35_01280 [Firmicutes bacterium]|nr:hypothetical protein [Bacillota bacterium]